MDTSVIEGFKLKQCPVDTWTTREHLCLTSAVSQTGEQNWGAVSRSVRQLTTKTDRPPDWYSTKNCALQYGRLLEQVDAPRRKREKGEALLNETPEQILFKMLVEKRVEELKGILEEEKVMYNQLRKEIIHLESNQLDNRLHQYWEEMLREQEVEDLEAEKQKKFIKEREEKIRLYQAASKLQLNKGIGPFSKKSSLSSVPSSSTTENSVHDYAKKEPDSSQMDTSECVPNIFPAVSSKTAFSSVTPPKTSSTFSQETSIDTVSGASSLDQTPQPSEKISDGKGEDDTPIIEKDFSLPIKEEQEEEKMPEAEAFEEIKCESSFESNMPLDYTSNLNAELKDDVHEISAEEEKKLLGTTDVNESDIKEEVINADDEREERKEESLVEDTQEEDKTISKEPEEKIDFAPIKSTENEWNKEGKNVEDLIKTTTHQKEKEEVEEEEEEEEGSGIKVEIKDEDKIKIKKLQEETKPLKLKEEERPSVIIPHKKELIEKVAEAEAKKTSTGPSPAEWSLPPTEIPLEKEGEKKVSKKEVKDEYEFDDDASRESTDVKEYMNRSDRRKFSLSENVSSPVVSESTPSSPASTSYGDDPEAEKSHRSWKRSIMLIWNDIAAHKNASLFLKPITEDKVPGYHSIVYRPIDLMTIKRNIESGSIRSTTEFQRDIMHMFLNAKMYNTRNNNIYRMANHMMNDAVETIEEFIQAQMLAKVVETPQKNLRRETRESSAKRGEDKRKREEREDKLLKRRKL